MCVLHVDFIMEHSPNLKKKCSMLRIKNKTLASLPIDSSHRPSLYVVRPSPKALSLWY